jgi:sugar (pentulose or hexulose) kinase
MGGGRTSGHNESHRGERECPCQQTNGIGRAHRGKNGSRLHPCQSRYAKIRKVGRHRPVTAKKKRAISDLRHFQRHRLSKARSILQLPIRV